MKRWFVCYNDYWYTAGISLEEIPVILCLLEWVADRILPYKVCNKITQYVFKHTKHNYFTYPYKMLEKKFPEIFTEMLVCDNEDEVIERVRHKRDSERIGLEIEAALNKLEDLFYVERSFKK